MTSPIAVDDLARALTVVDRDAPGVRHVFLAGGTYSILVTGEQTDGRSCLIDMTVPDGGGPPPHRHDFEELFTVLAGEVVFTFRGSEHRVSAGTTVNVPANAPHSFGNESGREARMLCTCTPAGQDAYFLRVGDLLESRTAAPPQLSDEDLQQRRERAVELAGEYRTELLR